MIWIPLLAALTFSAAAAVKPSSNETVWREARLTLERGDPAGAMKMVDDALARAGGSDAHDVWKLRIFRAVLLIQSRRLDEAEKLLAVPLPPSLRNSEAAARHLHAQAMLDESRRGTQWEALLEKARVIAVKEHALGALSEILRVRPIEPKVREAIRVARKSGDEFLVAKAEVALVFTLTRSGRYPEAVEFGERLVPRLQRERMYNTLARHLGNLGWAYSELGNHDRAAELYSLAIAECRRVGNLNDILTWFTSLSALNIARRDWAGAAREARLVIDTTAGQRHRSRADAFASLARALLETGHLADARAAVRMAQQLEPDDLLMRVVAARIDIAGGAFDTAKKNLLEAVAAEGKAAVKLEAQGQLARLYALRKQNDLAVRTFDAAVALVREARDATNSHDTRLTVFNNATELFDNYVDFLVSAGRHEDALRVTETSRAQMLAEARDLDVDRKLDLPAIARQRGASILCYWLGHKQSYLWTITGGGVRLTPLGKSRAEVESAVAAYSERLVSAAGTLDRVTPRGQALYNLLAGSAAIPSGSRVIVIPDGRLHTLNFETLVTPQKRFWIHDVTLANASSLHILARGTAPSPAAPKLLLVGNPPQADRAFPPLPQAADEIQRIRNRFAGGAKVLAGPAATPAAYEAAKPETFDFVHFVAHGVATRVRPLDSAVILGADAAGKYRLIARDIARQPLKARLVTISSCHGAGSATYAGEGLVGLAWAFLFAGAQQVVAALWAVNDTAAPKLMDEMYAGIRKGRDPAVALREAKLTLLRSAGPHRHARYWAPFVIYQ